jgi:hypothetical protein
VEPHYSHTLVPLTFGGELSSLSAILLNDQYYSLILRERTALYGLNVVNPAGLIALKIRAYQELSERRLRGEPVDSFDIRKHRTDVLRLGLLLDGTTRTEVGGTIKSDIDRFIQECREEKPDWKNLASSLGVPKNVVDARILDRISGHFTEGQRA